MTALVVEFSDELSVPDAARLRQQHGLQLIRPVDHRSYLEQIAPPTLSALSADFLVIGTRAYDATQKLAPSLEDLQTDAEAPAELIAILFEASNPDTARTAIEACGADNVRMIDDRSINGSLSLAFQLADASRLSAISKIDEVVWIEPNLPAVPHATTPNVDAARAMQSGTVGQGTVWDKGLQGEGQVVSVIDLGIPAIGHCFFSYMPNSPNVNHRKILAIHNSSSGVAADHPTAVCGIVAGDEWGNPGKNVNRGGAFAAKLVYSNQQDMKSKSLKEILHRAQKSGASIHTCPWGIIKDTDYTKVSADVDEFCWDNEDAIVICSAGNTYAHEILPNHYPEEPNGPPSNAKNCLSVLATQEPPDLMKHGSGVDGPTTDGRRKPEIAGIGGVFEVADFATGCGVRFSMGYATSWAAPHVAAAAALVRQYFQEGFYVLGKKAPSHGFTPTGALIKAVLLNSTIDMTAVNNYPSDTEGWGVIRLDRTLYFEGDTRRLIVKDVRRASGLNLALKGDSQTFHFAVDDSSEQLKITLVWNDFRPHENDFAKPVVNILGLEAFAHSAPKTIYSGNDINLSTGLSNPNGQGPPDDKNNVQMVIIDSPVKGRWSVKVSSRKMSILGAWSSQGFALVFSGGIIPSSAFAPTA